MMRVRSSIGTVLESIILAQTGLDISCPECKDEINTLNQMSPDAVLRSAHKFAGRIVNRAMARHQPWYLRLCVTVVPKLAISVVSDWIRQACRAHCDGTFAVESFYDIGIPAFDAWGVKTVPTIIDRDRFAGRCIAVTSLSPNQDRQSRQALCLQSWRDMGLQILAVNTADELKVFGKQIQQHITPVISEAPGSPRIKALLNAGAATGVPFLLINSDIEIYGDHAAIETALNRSDRLTIGVRYNHDLTAPRERSHREASGLDVFLLTPQMADTVPDLPFQIGQPVWDYWLPCHFRRCGYDFNWLHSPLFFHERHDVQWSHDDWRRGAEVLTNHYGVALTYGSGEFRKSLGDGT